MAEFATNDKDVCVECRESGWKLKGRYVCCLWCRYREEIKKKEEQEGNNRESE